jgi:hypothetical protein
LDKEEFLNSIKKSISDEKIKDKWTLKFKARDIKYLIVKNENEMVHLFDAIDSMASNFNEKERKLLKTRIISTSQIQEDF